MCNIDTRKLEEKLKFWLCLQIVRVCCSNSNKLSFASMNSWKVLAGVFKGVD